MSENCGLPKMRSISQDAITSREVSSSGTSNSSSNRKHHRGQIEKHRRDRINDALMKLKNLVPNTKQKAGSAKLEKAEILEGTVAFLTDLYKRGQAMNVQMQILEDKHIAFRECLDEVQRISKPGSSPLVDDIITHIQQRCNQIEREMKVVCLRMEKITRDCGGRVAPQHQTTMTFPQSNVLQRTPQYSQWYTEPVHSGVMLPAAHLNCINVPNQQPYPQLNPNPRYQPQPQLGQQLHFGSAPKRPCPHSPKASATAPPPAPAAVTDVFAPYPGVEMEMYQPNNLPGYPTPINIPLSSYSHACGSSGQNESQSTSSPPFHSTPEDDTELINSPQISGKLEALVDGSHSKPELVGFNRPDIVVVNGFTGPNDTSMVTMQPGSSSSPFKQNLYRPIPEMGPQLSRMTNGNAFISMQPSTSSIHNSTYQGDTDMFVIADNKARQWTGQSVPQEGYPMNYYQSN